MQSINDALRFETESGMRYMIFIFFFITYHEVIFPKSSNLRTNGHVNDAS